jgi:hypothetical protein
MKVLEVRISVADSVSSELLNDLGEELQISLPVDCAQNGLKVHDITATIHEPSKNKQTITVTLDLQKGQAPYKLVEGGHGRRRYQALRHFFEDIGYRVFKIATILLFVAAGTFGQQQLHIERLDAPIAKPQLTKLVADKKFWVAMGVLAASDAADSVTTRQALDRGAYEYNPLYGTHPSNGRLITVSCAYLVGEVVLAYELKRFSRKHRWARWMWLVEPSWQTVQHVRVASHNEALPRPR